MNNTDVVMTCTSMPSRINELHRALNSLVSNTIKPLKIVVNLSLEEFPNAELDLPSNLDPYLHNDLFEFHWVKHNTFTYKKVFPTVDRYPDKAIFSFDDDIEYPSNFIEAFIDTFNKYDGKYNITLVQFMGNITYTPNIGRGYLMAPGVMNQYRYYLTREDFPIKHDDAFICMYLLSRGIYSAPVLGLKNNELIKFNNKSEWISDMNDTPDMWKVYKDKAYHYNMITQSLNIDFKIPNQLKGNYDCRERIEYQVLDIEW